LKVILTLSKGFAPTKRTYTKTKYNYILNVKYKQ